VDPATERALVQGLRVGDVKAFDEVYAAFNARLLTFLVRLSRRAGPRRQPCAFFLFGKPCL